MNTAIPVLSRVVLLLLPAFALTGPARAQNGLPRPDHVLIAIDENRRFTGIIGATDAPYINSLAAQGALFTSSFAIRHPSQPNYLALFSGSTHGIGDDSCPHTFHGPNLASELFDAGLTFAGYSESMPRAGYGGCSAGGYQRKHNPWVNFANVPDSANLPFTSFPTNFAELPTVSVVVPNQNNDMHDGSTARGDAWLRDHLDAYVQWARTNNSLFILTWDEGHGTENQIATIFVGPMVRPGIYCERINHYAVLRTLLDMYGLPAIVKSASADPITSVWTPESAPLPVSIEITNPAPGTHLLVPAAVTWGAEASSAGSDIAKVEFYQRGTKLGEATNRPFAFTWRNIPAGSYCVVAKATDALGRKKTSASVDVLVAEPDLTLPGVSIFAPPQNARVTNNIITLQGTASDDRAVARVEYQVGDGPFHLADGNNDWSAQIELPPGASTIRVRSVDASGNASRLQTRTVTCVVLSPITVHITGNGAMVPELDGQNLEVGRLYEWKPAAAAGFVFAQAGIAAASPGRQRFTMQSNLVLEIGFVANPFPPAPGTYQGLLWDTNGATARSSGSFKLALTARGGFTVRGKLGGKSLHGAGAFDAFGHASTKVLSGDPFAEEPSNGTPAAFYAMDCELDLRGGTDEIRGALRRIAYDRATGHVLQDDFYAAMLGDRAVFDAATHSAPWAGRYTVLFSRDTNATTGPDGDGFGAVTVDANGRVRLAGALADGTKVAQSTSVSGDGQWPLYLSLYGGRGAMVGWLTVTNDPAIALQGLPGWIKPGLPSAKFYPAGFTNENRVIGSAYRPPSSTDPHILDFTNGLAMFEGGNLAAPFTNAIRIEANNTVSNNSSNRLALVFARQTGLWKGTATDPATVQSISMRGAVLQNRSEGAGFFLGTNASGRVSLRKE